MRRTIPITFVTIIILSFTQCQKEEKVIVPVNVPAGKGHDLLSEYHFFEGDIKSLTANEVSGVLPYDLNVALFSDYASKLRFIYVPEGSTIRYDTAEILDMPVGTVLIKHFYFFNSENNQNNIETRLLIKRENDWQPEIYEWNETQTDAKRTVIGGTQKITANIKGQNRTLNYLVPNQNQCKNCHNFDGKLIPIGPRIHNLNKDYTYTEGRRNQLEKWQSSGFLSTVNVSTAPSWPKIDDMVNSLNSRARAYLAVNCASCHSRHGSAGNSGLYLEYNNRDSLQLGFWKGPVAAGNGSGNLNYVIHPGKAEQSILLFRMISDKVEERMPEIGRELPHEEGIALIREWIDSQK